MITVLMYVVIAAIVVGVVYAIIGYKKKPEKELPEIICTNANCGYKGKPSREKQRSTLVFVFLFIMWMLPGIVYYLLVPEFKYWCPECQTKLKI